MELIKGYKQVEGEVIPEDWTLKKLGEICSPSNNRINPLTTSINYKCVELEHISQGTGRLLGYTELKLLKSQKNVFEKSDVLFGKLRPYLRKFLYAEFDGACTTEIWVLKSNREYDSNWLYYHIQSNKVINVANQSIGTKMPRADWKKVSDIVIPTPPSKAEQTAIANSLSDIDALIQSLEILIQKKRAIKQGALEKMLKPKEGWVVKKLEELFEITAGGDLRVNEFAETQDNTYCYPIYANALTNSGLYGYNSTYDYEGNCITVTARGAVGFANYRNHKFCAIGRLLILKPKEELDCIYLSEYINLRVGFVNESTGVPQLTAPQISKYEVIIPEYKEQVRIANILADMDKEIITIENKLFKYKQVKQGMMQNLLTGRIRLV